MSAKASSRHTHDRTAGRVYWETNADAFRRSFQGAGRRDVVVASKREWLRTAFGEALHRSSAGATRRIPRILVTDRLGESERAAYRALSDAVLDRGIARILPVDELREVMSAPNRDELFAGVSYAPESGVVTLYRGTLEPLLVPAGWFTSAPAGSRADLDAIVVTDYGQTVRLGGYEVAADAILYEFDSSYRSKARARLRHDSGIGGSIRRLRKQRGLRQEDFEGVSRREISRIERGEIVNPRMETLQRIGDRLGVSIEDLRTY